MNPCSFATRRTARTRQLIAPVKFGALVECVELALVDGVDAGLDDTVDAGEPHLVARGALDRRPACEARVRRGLLRHVVPADVESVAGAPRGRAVPRDGPDARIGGVRRAGHPGQGQRDRDGRALERRAGPEDRALLEVRSLRELELVARGTSTGAHEKDGVRGKSRAAGSLARRRNGLRLRGAATDFRSGRARSRRAAWLRSGEEDEADVSHRPYVGIGARPPSLQRGIPHPRRGTVTPFDD